MTAELFTLNATDRRTVEALKARPRRPEDLARPIKNIAIMIKASNLAYQGRELSSQLEWNAQGARRDRFPVLDVRNLRKAEAS